MAVSHWALLFFGSYIYITIYKNTFSVLLIIQYVHFSIVVDKEYFVACIFKSLMLNICALLF